jgi:hypothetical protein
MSTLKPKHTYQSIQWQRTSKQIAYAWKTQRTSRKLHEILFATTCDMLGFVFSRTRPSTDSHTFPKPQVEWGLSPRNFHSRQQYFSVKHPQRLSKCKPGFCICDKAQKSRPLLVHISKATCTTIIATQERQTTLLNLHEFEVHGEGGNIKFTWGSKVFITQSRQGWWYKNLHSIGRDERYIKWVSGQLTKSMGMEVMRSWPMYGLQIPGQ